MSKWGPSVEILQFARENGKPYSEMLSISLGDGDPAYFKWFLASILYSKPIRETNATKTYRLFEHCGLADPRSIIKAGWDRLVEVLDEGGYTRYDFSTADRLLEICRNLIAHYNASLDLLHQRSSDSRDLERRLMELGKGVGPVTVSVFLRDMRRVWSKADPLPTPKVRVAMSALGISDLKEFAKREGLDLVELETALHRYSRLLIKSEARTKI
jgi:endonuclease III